MIKSGRPTMRQLLHLESKQERSRQVKIIHFVSVFFSLVLKKVLFIYMRNEIRWRFHDLSSILKGRKFYVAFSSSLDRKSNELLYANQYLNRIVNLNLNAQTNFRILPSKSKEWNEFFDLFEIYL